MIEGTTVGFLRMKLRMEPSFGFKAVLSRFAFFSRHIFVPQCRFSMLAAPPGPQLRRAPSTSLEILRSHLYRLEFQTAKRTFKFSKIT